MGAVHYETLQKNPCDLLLGNFLHTTDIIREGDVQTTLNPSRNTWVASENRYRVMKE